jgi:hypothetical protein
MGSCTTDGFMHNGAATGTMIGYRVEGESERKEKEEP